MGQARTQPLLLACSSKGLTRKGVRVEYIKESFAFPGRIPHGQPHALRHGALPGSERSPTRERQKRPG
jgi:hypothetical protein